MDLENIYNIEFYNVHPYKNVSYYIIKSYYTLIIRTIKDINILENTQIENVMKHYFGKYHIYESTLIDENCYEEFLQKYKVICYDPYFQHTVKRNKPITFLNELEWLF